MDAAREHLWSQLLQEQGLVESGRLQQLIAERDHMVRTGQDCSIGQLLLQKRELDAGRFQTIRHDIEGRGRACFSCRKVFFARAATDPQTCPGCGGPSRLPPPQSGAHPGVGSGARPAVPGSDRFPPPPGSGHHPPVGSGSYSAPGGSGRFPAHQQSYGSFVQPAGSGRYGAQPGGSGSFGAQPGYNAQGSVYGSHPGGSFGTGYAPAAAADSVPTMGPGMLMSNGRPLSTRTAEDDGFEMSGELEGGELGVGKKFGDYEIVAELGRGGMGVVYKASPAGRPNQFVALKVLLAGEFASEKLKKRFKAEAELSHKLDHPNIVPVFDVGEIDGLLFYTMGYVEGQELQEMIRNKSLPIRRGVEILVEVSQAAHHAHQHGVVHRDLKPSNILVGSDGTPYIMDFGLAKNLEADQGLTKSGVAIGTPYYMPPEQARGNHREMDARSDVYALGAILYEVATRRVPFTAKTQNELLRKIIEEEPMAPRQVRPGVPVDLETVCLKSLCKEKSGRYGSALELAEDLERFLAGEPVKAKRAAPWAGWLRKAKRNRTTAAVVLVSVLAVLSAVGIIAVLHSKHQEQLRLDEERRLADEKARKEQEEKERKEREAADKKRRAQEAKRQQAERAITSGQDAYSASRSATSYAEQLRALERAENAFDDAVAIETEMSGAPRASTAYRRGLVRRLRCSWDRASEDFLLAAKSNDYRARGYLAAGLIQLRQFGDQEGAKESFRQASKSQDVSDLEEAEEATAESLARAFLSLTDGDAAGATRQLSSLSARGGLGGLSAEVNGALAFVARLQGKPLGGDVHVRGGLRAAQKAVSADRFRYDFLIDRAILLARDGKRQDALRDQRSARNLDVDGPWAEVADAVIQAMPGGDAKRVGQSLAAALAKARRRSAKVEEQVRTTADAIKAAVEAREAEEAAQRMIQDDRIATIDFNPGPAEQEMKLYLKVTSRARAVLLQLRGATEDVDFYVSYGQESTYKMASVKANTPSPDETVVMRRDGYPALRDGVYSIFVRPSKPLRQPAKVKLGVRFFKNKADIPFVWERANQFSFRSRSAVEKLNGILADMSRKSYSGMNARFKSLVDEEPLAAAVQVQILVGRDDLPDEVAGKHVFAELLPRLKMLTAQNPQYMDHMEVALAMSLMRAGTPDEAVSRLKQAIEKHPRRIELRLGLARVYEETKQFKEALAVVDEVKTLKGGEAPRLELLAGQVLLASSKKDRQDEGARRMAAALASAVLEPSQALVAARSLIVKHKRYREGMQGVQGIAARLPGVTNIDLECLRAYCVAGLGERDRGIQALKTLITRIPAGRAKLTATCEQGIRDIEAAFPASGK